MLNTCQVTTQEEIAIALGIRRVVFIEGQGVAEEREQDGLENEATHFLVWQDKIPIATARYRVLDGNAKLERIAVLEAWRGQKIGARLIEYMIKHIKENHKVENVVLSGQMSKLGFYRKIGFVPYGETYIPLLNQERYILHAKGAA